MAKYGSEFGDLKIAAGRRNGHDPPLIQRAYRTGNTKPMTFVSLHHHSTFSYDDGYALPEAHLRRAEELMMNGCAFTEHGNISSHVRAERAAEKLGMPVYYGCELYTGKVGEGATQRKYHLTVLAATPEGYSNLVKLVTRSWRDGFYYEPTVSWQMLKEHRNGIVVLSGCQGSLLFCSAVGGKLIAPEDASLARAIKVARAFAHVFGDRYFIEVQAHPELDDTRRFNKLAPQIAAASGAELVATMDCHYTALDEREIQKILHNTRPGETKTLEEQVRDWGYKVPLCPPPNDRSIYRRLIQTGLPRKWAEQAIKNTALIAGDLKVTLPKLDRVRFPLPTGYDSTYDYLLDRLRKGWKFRGYHRLPAAERKRERELLLKEIEIIRNKDFIDYFLIVSDLVVFAKDQGCPVGPGRGSAAASRVCYHLRITEVEPRRFRHLLFERFIDVTREDLPDIDLDFPGSFRPRLRQYAVGKYGRECVNNLGTRTMYKAKLALDTVGRVYRIPKADVETVKELLIERSSGDLRASATIEDTIEQFDRAREVAERHPEIRRATWLEGNAKGEGVHAAGLVISTGPITDVCSFMVREVPKGSGRQLEVITHDKYDAERQGLLKIDLLGLNTMEMLWACCRRIGMPVTDLYAIPLKDTKTIRGFQTDDVVGVFQFDGAATRSVNNAVVPDSFAEVCDCGALSRPGPLHNGAAMDYAKTKHGASTSKLAHPALAPITASTKGQIVYQEQILRIVREIGAFDWTAASHIRTIISRKYGDQAFNREWDRFWSGARTYHRRHVGAEPIGREVARAIWGDLITSGSYAFNAAHTVSYGLISWWCMWFKQHHRNVFYAEALNHLSDEKEHDILRDTVKKGRRIFPPDPQRSERRWQPVRRGVLAGFEQIPGIAEKQSALIVANREAVGGLESWDDLQRLKGIGPKTVAKVKAFVEDRDPFGAFRIDRNIKRVVEALDSLGLPRPNGTAHHLPESGRVVWLGTILDRNIRDMFELNKAKGQEVDPDRIKDPHLSEFALLRCEDSDGQLLIKVDRWKYPKVREQLFDFRLNEDLLLVEGRRPQYTYGATKIVVKNLWVIDPE